MVDELSDTEQHRLAHADDEEEEETHAPVPAPARPAPPAQAAVPRPVQPVKRRARPVQRRAQPAAAAAALAAPAVAAVSLPAPQAEAAGSPTGARCSYAQSLIVSGVKGLPPACYVCMLGIRSWLKHGGRTPVRHAASATACVLGLRVARVRLVRRFSCTVMLAVTDSFTTTCNVGYIMCRLVLCGHCARPSLRSLREPTLT